MSAEHLAGSGARADLSQASPAVGRRVRGRAGNKQAQLTRESSTSRIGTGTGAGSGNGRQRDRRFRQRLSFGHLRPPAPAAPVRVADSPHPPEPQNRVAGKTKTKIKINMKPRFYKLHPLVQPFKFPPCPYEYKILALHQCPTPEAMQHCESAAKAADYWRRHIVSDPYFNPECECLVALLLNTRHRVKGHYVITTGTMDTLLVHPRECSGWRS